MDQGKYSLKPEYWAEWDPYFYHYDNADQQATEERYAEYCKSISKERVLACPKPIDPPSNFAGM